MGEAGRCAVITCPAKSVVPINKIDAQENFMSAIFSRADLHFVQGTAIKAAFIL